MLSFLTGESVTNMRLSKLFALVALDMTLMITSLGLGLFFFKISGEQNVGPLIISAIVGELVLFSTGAYRSVISESGLKSEWWRCFFGAIGASAVFSCFFESNIYLTISVTILGTIALVLLRILGRLRLLRITRKYGLCIYGAGRAGIDVKALLESTGHRKVHFFC